MTTYHSDITDPIAAAVAFMEGAEIHAQLGDEARAHDQHSAAGVQREIQRHYMKRAEMHLELSKAQSLASIADDLAALRLNQ